MFAAYKPYCVQVQMLAALVFAIRIFVGLEFVILWCRTVTVPRLKETEKYRAKDGRPYISNYKWYTGRGNSCELKIIDTRTSIASMRHTVCMYTCAAMHCACTSGAGRGPSYLVGIDSAVQGGGE